MTWGLRVRVLVLMAACASPAALYEQQGKNGLALEYLLREPKSAEDGSRARVVAAMMRNARSDRDESLRRGAMRGALAANLSLIEQDAADGDARAAHAKIKMAAAERERAKLDAMTERGVPHVADLNTCRTALALDGGDELRERCAALRTRLMVHAVLDMQGPARIGSTISAEPHDLFDVVSSTDVNKNATLTVTVSEPLVDSDSDFVEVGKRGRHVMVPTGKKEKVTVPPTEKEIEEAKKANKPTPQPRTEEKALYKQVTGQYTLYRRVAAVAVPYSYALRRQRDGVITAAGAGVKEAKSTSEYFDYTGDDKARDDPRGWPEGRGNARPVLSNRELRDNAESRIAPHVLDAMVTMTERE